MTENTEKWTSRSLLLRLEMGGCRRRKAIRNVQAARAGNEQVPGSIPLHIYRRAGRKPTLKRFLLFVVHILFLSLASGPVLSCSCEPPGPPLEELAVRDAVFAGRVVEIVEKIADTEDLSIPFERSSEDLWIHFELSAVWKGELRKDVAIRTGADDAQCGYYFELGEQYLVYASSWQGDLYAGICSRTNALAAAAGEVEQLGEPISRWPPNDDTGDFLAVPEILGRWEIESGMEKDASISNSPSGWRLLEFRPDGVCVANLVLPDLLAVAEFPYAKERTLLFGDEKWQKVVLSPIQSAYVNRGNGWGAETFQVWPGFFFALRGNGKLVAIVGNLGILSAASFRRTDRPIYSVTPDGRVTSVAPTPWGAVKKETRQPSPN